MYRFVFERNDTMTVENICKQFGLIVSSSKEGIYLNSKQTLSVEVNVDNLVSLLNDFFLLFLIQ